MVAALLDQQEGAGPPVEAVDAAAARSSRTAMMSPTCTRGAPPASPAQVAGRSFSALPTRWSTSGIAAKPPGAIWTPQPVTTMRLPGRWRRRRRMAWRACRSASAVTAQVWTITVSSRAAARAWRRITSDSSVLSRQPKVTISTAGSAGIGEQLRRQQCP